MVVIVKMVTLIEPLSESASECDFFSGFDTDSSELSWATSLLLLLLPMTVLKLMTNEH